MSLVVRPAAPSDREAVVRLLAGQFEALASPQPAERLARAVDGVFADPGRGAFLLALEAERPLGIAYLSFQWALEHGGRAAWLEELFVEPAARGRGVGERLLRGALEHARAEGCAAVDLEVDEAHPRAASLYAREGFVRRFRQRFVRLA